MEKFRVGDRVRVVEENEHVKLGATGTVVGYFWGIVDVKWDSYNSCIKPLLCGEKYALLESRLELIEETPDLTNLTLIENCLSTVGCYVSSEIVHLIASMTLLIRVKGSGATIEDILRVKYNVEKEFKGRNK